MTSPLLQVPMQPLIPVDPWPKGRVHRHDREWRPGLGYGMSTAEAYARLYDVAPYHPIGMGATITGGAASADQIAATGAATTVSILVALGTIGGPVGAVIGGLIAIGSLIAGMFGGCGQTCVISSQDANKVGDFMAQNMNTYLSSPVHYKSLQTAALNNYDTAWKALVAACSNPQLGSAGQACISDRQQGACKWKASPGGWQQQNGTWVYVPWGPAGSGSACWNYFVGMRDPIANDPTVVPDPVSTTPGGTTSTGGTVTSAPFNFQELMPLALIAGAVILAMVIL